jgi:hypothetical protein
LLPGNGFHRPESLNFRVQGFMFSLAIAYLIAAPELK